MKILRTIALITTVIGLTLIYSCAIDYASIPVSPSLGSYLTNSENTSSEVILKDVQVCKGMSNKQYLNPWYPEEKVNAGEPILVVCGTIQNKHRQNTYITLDAKGYDAKGQQVSWTLDAAHIPGQIALQLETEEKGQFILHLNIDKNIKSIRIFANNYDELPP
jgi:hypothetical protein